MPLTRSLIGVDRPPQLAPWVGSIGYWRTRGVHRIQPEFIRQQEQLSALSQRSPESLRFGGSTGRRRLKDELAASAGSAYSGELNEALNRANALGVSPLELMTAQQQARFLRRR